MRTTYTVVGHVTAKRITVGLSHEECMEPLRSTIISSNGYEVVYEFIGNEVQKHKEEHVKYISTWWKAPE